MMPKQKTLIITGAIIIIIVSIITLYQIIRAIFGGTWSTENITIALLILNLTISFTLAGMIGDLRSKLYGHFGYHKGLEERLKKA